MRTSLVRPFVTLKPQLIQILRNHNLQDAFSIVYDEAAYACSLDYRRPCRPPLAQAEAGWARALLAAAGLPAA